VSTSVISSVYSDRVLLAVTQLQTLGTIVRGGEGHPATAASPALTLIPCWPRHCFHPSTMQISAACDVLPDGRRSFDCRVLLGRRDSDEEDLLARRLAEAVWWVALDASNRRRRACSRAAQAHSG
jgi:hypothetical protein